MPVWPDLRKVVEQLRELDVGALRTAAETPPHVVVLGAATKMRADVVAGLQRGPCLLYTSPSPRDRTRSRMPSSA